MNVSRVSFLVPGISRCPGIHRPTYQTAIPEPHHVAWRQGDVSCDHDRRRDAKRVDESVIIDDVRVFIHSALGRWSLDVFGAGWGCDGTSRDEVIAMFCAWRNGEEVKASKVKRESRKRTTPEKYAEKLRAILHLSNYYIKTYGTPHGINVQAIIPQPSGKAKTLHIRLVHDMSEANEVLGWAEPLIKTEIQRRINNAKTEVA